MRKREKEKEWREERWDKVWDGLEEVERREEKEVMGDLKGPRPCR